MPPDRVRAALRFAKTAPVIRGFWHSRGLRMVATDIDWSVGTGPEVHGPGEAVLLASAGRSAALADLDGPGTARLRAGLHDAGAGVRPDLR